MQSNTPQDPNIVNLDFESLDQAAPILANNNHPIDYTMPEYKILEINGVIAIEDTQTIVSYHLQDTRQLFYKP